MLNRYLNAPRYQVPQTGIQQQQQQQNRRYAVTTKYIPNICNVDSIVWSMVCLVSSAM